MWTWGNFVWQNWLELHILEVIVYYFVVFLWRMPFCMRLDTYCKLMDYPLTLMPLRLNVKTIFIVCCHFVMRLVPVFWLFSVSFLPIIILIIVFHIHCSAYLNLVAIPILLLLLQPQNTVPDVIIWMLSAGKRVASCRIPSHKLMYSTTAKARGQDCGKMQTVFLMVSLVYQFISSFMKMFWKCRPICLFKQLHTLIACTHDSKVVAWLRYAWIIELLMCELFFVLPETDHFVFL